jgi:ABC-type glutathione transport system ATPase component
MTQMRLTAVADTVVGDSKIRGISGGERKRLSVAVELIQSPSIIFLDEPTSGLDSTAATTLIQNLRDLADEGKTVIAVIHQPSQHVFSKFDDLLLVAEGKLMYYGELNHVRDYMTELGYPAPADMGTAEHVLDCISREPIEDETMEEAVQRVNKLAQKAKEMTIDLGLPQTESRKKYNTHGVTSNSRHGPKAGIVRQFRLLLKRSFREVTRGKTAIFVKTIQQITLGLIYGGIYKLGNDQASIQDRFGLLSLVAIGSSNMVRVVYYMGIRVIVSATMPQMFSLFFVSLCTSH